MKSHGTAISPSAFSWGGCSYLTLERDLDSSSLGWMDSSDLTRARKSGYREDRVSSYGWLLTTSTDV